MKLFITFFLIMFFMGCVTAPDRKDFTNESSYFAAYCLFINKNNPDKSSCKNSLAAADCFNRYIFCLNSENRPEGKLFDYCLTKLNQK